MSYTFDEILQKRNDWKFKYNLKQKRQIKEYKQEYLKDCLQHQLQNILNPQEDYTIQELKYLAKTRIFLQQTELLVEEQTNKKIDLLLRGIYSYSKSTNDLINENKLNIYKIKENQQNNNSTEKPQNNEKVKKTKKSKNPIEEIFA
jgi:preprotein translocase subunit SecD